MSYTQRDVELVFDIVRACYAVRSYISDIEQEVFGEDSLLQDAAMRQIAVIGEAASRLSPEFRTTHAEVPWRSIIAMRNALIHGYDRVNMARVWLVAQHDVPELIAHLEPLLPPEP